MFSFRKKPQKPTSPIRTSPSLPELSAQGIPWPSDLVDLSQLPHSGDAHVSPPRGAAKTSFSADVAGPVAFHKPWAAPGKPSGQAGKTIASLYASHPPVAFDGRKSSMSNRSRPAQKRNRNPTTFNLMGTGKTSLLRLILDTADISPTATADQKAAMEGFLRGSPRCTEQIQTACVEICESKYDRLLLSVIDTPGLDFQDGHELRLERQVTTIVKYLDAQFADTLSEESKVVRQSRGDQHIHLLIYMIDPASIMNVSARRAHSTFPSKTRSETTIGYRTKDVVNGAEESDDEEEDSESTLTMSPVDLRVIRRLSVRANVLPVVALSDSLTDETLATVKKVIRRDLRNAGLDFGVFGPTMDDPQSPQEEPRSGRNGTAVRVASDDISSAANGDAAGTAPSTNGDAPVANGNSHALEPSSSSIPSTPTAAEDPSPASEDARPSRPVIKLRATRLQRRPSLSRSRLEAEMAMVDDTTQPDMMVNDNESVASVRFSAHIVAKTDLMDTLPFALITPEHVRRRRALKGAVASPVSANGNGNGAAFASLNGHADDGAVTPSEGHSGAYHSMALPVPARAPADLRGVFVRRFRWGTVDVLDPAHCDFSALRTAVLSTHIKMLKIRTKEVLYEKYRTEKLLARRATRNISEDETKRLLEDLGL
ncbi:uncharacterized protein BXZ73DRAFT_104066 [Epithele typhae]|uniref:uncharacterized protein n=1 Tax=Epithele typhae TaxID=378194 RepID=UPI002007697E|nr:uncharacterized protein BXZ73DRAFT_104066 [Epithele typhae]KAH9922835.1 hypothetical protein BXZ73DRAFT_104066 [Epithele typhae]